MTTFRPWVFGCSHLATDGAVSPPRESLALALQQSETPAFGGWDIAIDLGDHNGTPPASDKSGVEMVRQRAVLTQHPIEAIYPVGGNHDKEAAGEPYGWWVQRYPDPMGTSPLTSGIVQANRPYAIDGTWERYKFQVGNIVFLMMSDVARPSNNLRGICGGDPGGSVTQETFDWWRGWCEYYRNRSEIVVTCHHYLPKDTTIATGDCEGGTIVNGVYVPHYHGAGFDPKGSGRLYYIGDTVDADDFMAHLAQYPGDCALWFGAHTHALPGTTLNGRGLRQNINGCEFINCAALTLHHGKSALQQPRSRLFEFTSSSNIVTMRNWYHTTLFNGAIGYAGNPISLTLPKTVTL